ITTICELEKGRNKNKLLIEKVIDYLNKRKEELIKKTQEQLNYFLKILNSCLIQVILKEKRKIKPTGFFYDLYIPNYHSFIANGILLHNSQRRYDRIREDALHEFLKKVGETASQLFLEQKNLKGIIIGGPGPIKESFAEKDYLHYQLKKKFLGVKDVSYTGEYGLEELVERSEDLLKEAAISKERELLVNFFIELKNNGKVVYGLEDTLKALEANSVDTLLISEEFDWVRVRLKCPQCNYFLKKDLARKIASEQVCPKCKKNLALEESNNLVDILKEMAEERGIRVEFISATSKEGIRFKQIGGIGALLKYKIEK
ncbi:MAG: peptide chain release factor aRF-1, partial [Candidatus Aenigmatarchaeota archaeon]